MSDEISLETGPEYQPQQRMLTWLFKQKDYPIPTEEERLYFPYKDANIISKILFLWVAPNLRVGYSRTIRPNDLYKLTNDQDVLRMTVVFNAKVKKIVEDARKKYDELTDPKVKAEPFKFPQYTVAKAIIHTLKYDITKATIFGAIALIFMSLTPLLMKQLIKYVEEKSIPALNTKIGPGIGYAIGCSLALTVTGFLFVHYLNVGLQMGIKAKSILITAVLEKSFRLLAVGRKKHTPGKITSLMGTDLSRVDFSMLFQPLLFTLPIALIISIVILLINIGVAALIGIGVFFFFLVIIGAGTAKMFEYRSAIQRLTDKRVEIIKEVLSNLKMIKFYSWETPYLNKIIAARLAEIKAILKIQAARNVINSMALSLTGISAMVSFLSLYKIQGHTKSPAQIFSSVSSFETLATCTFLLPLCLSTLVDLLNAFRRVERLLSCEEIEENPNFINNISGPEFEKSNNAIDIESATFSWDSTTIPDDDNEIKQKEKEKKAKEKEIANLKKRGLFDEKAEEKKRREEVAAEGVNYAKHDGTFAGLKEIQLQIQKGEFVVITGVIGSGKSSLLHAISGIMKLDSGKVIINGDYLLCGEPWIQNATIKENIIFGSPFDRKKYADTLHCCSLQQDLNSFDGGDMTEVGERGITLSGGQKARINLARAVYASPDVILLDDVLSAVDARVGKHIVKECLLKQLGDKTRILATHQLSLIHHADKVIYLNNDGSIDFGTLPEVKERNEGFRSLMSFSHVSGEIDDDDDEVDPVVAADPFHSSNEKESYETNANESDDDSEYNGPRDLNKGKLVEDEEKAVNRIKFQVYTRYLGAGVGKLNVGGFLALFSFSAALATFCNLFTNTWLSFWVEQKFPGKSSLFYMGIYAMMTFSATIFICLEFFILVTVTTKSSKVLNLGAVRRLLKAPMSFIDTTPTGRILNRFTKDTDALDNEISENLRFLFYGLANLIGILVLCCIYLPWLLIALPVILFVFVCFSDYFQASTREVKRIEAVQRSFVYNNYSESLNGMATIKAYGATHRFIRKNQEYINKTNEASFFVIANQRWLSIQLEIMIFFFSLMITLMCVNRVFKISAASAGLIISYSFSIGNELSQFIRLYTQVENDMNSAERVQGYAYNMAQEPPFEIPANKPDLSWPQHGAIKFENASMAYRKGLPLVLKELNLDIKAGEKIGICGRTGAGKSSIMTALFRLTELEKGKITIDGIDISKLGLLDLRSNLLIIPQDPVLFNGTVRRNLDPFDEKSDDEVWDALRRSGLIEQTEFERVKASTRTITLGANLGANLETASVAGGEKEFEGEKEASRLHKFHLDQFVEELGSNFSLGERQMISFARALLRNTKILILDEATSSVDYETDAKIQKVISQEFADCTILCIAHRLKTIIGYDRILTLDRGKKSEFDTPWRLFNSKGIFNQICQKSSISAADFDKKY